MLKLALVALSLAITAPTALQTCPAGDDNVRRVVEQFFDAYRAVDADRFASLFAADALFEDPTLRQRHQGRDAIRKTAMDMQATFRDVAIEVHSMVIGGEAVATEETVSGTVRHADGRSRAIKVRSASFFRVRNGRIEKLTQYSDAQTFHEQMRAGA